MTAATSTLPDVSAPARRHDPLGRRYGRLWARLPRELGYLALTAVIYLALLRLLRVVIGGLAVGILAVLVLGLLLLAGRYLGTFERTRLRWARTPEIPAPRWSRPFRGKTFLRGVGDVFGNGHSWTYSLHSLVLNPLLAAVTTAVWLGWLVVSLFLVSAPIRLLAAGAPALGLHGFPGATRLHLLSLPSDPGWAVAGATALGLGMLALLPLVTRGATLAHWGLGRLLLARFRSEDLEQDVARADSARAAAIVAEDSALRRLERDIHDGPQQRLLRLQMELATAERRLQQDGDAIGPLRLARSLAGETLDELRALASGFAPPLLQDRGLSAALGALGRRGAVPVETAVDLPAALPEPLERSVYFVAAELVTNAIRHSGATRIRLEARSESGELVLVVRDDGRGGASEVPGHGLQGLAARLAGLGGTLHVDSPAGGPTAVTARVPLP